MPPRPNLFRMAIGAFLLREDTYSDMRDDPQRLTRGIVFIIIVGVLAGAAAAIGQLGQWAMSPNLDTVQATVLKHLTQMTWYTMLTTESGGEFTTQFTQWYNTGWTIAKATAPSPAALGGILVQPVLLLIGWVIYGILAHLSAKLLGGKGSLGQTLGCTALASAPQLLTLIQVLPYAAAAGAGAWTLVCNFTALRLAHGLHGWRALFATLLPILVLAGVGLILATLGLLIAGAVIYQMGGVR